MEVLDTMLCVVGNEAANQLRIQASKRLSSAFRPKTRACYVRLFRSFTGFCICINVSVKMTNLSTVMSFLEYLVVNNTSVHMLSNYVSALKAMSVVHNMNFTLFDHPQVKYYLKAVEINRPLAVPKRNIIDIPTLKRLISLVSSLKNAATLRALFLVAYFGFFRLSNLVPHVAHEFDPSRHFAGGDVFFGKSTVKLLLKWSKTLQYRNQVKVISLPRLDSSICPYRALQDVLRTFSPSAMEPLFLCHTPHGRRVITDSTVRKTLATLNQAMGCHRAYFTFHAFRRSGASLAYSNRAPIEDIQQHGTWTSECVWRYISLDDANSGRVAHAFRALLH